MKKFSALLPAVILLAVLTACTPQPPVEESTAPTQISPHAPVRTGWHTIY